MRNRNKETQWDELAREEQPKKWIARAERVVTEKGDFREESFPVWDGDDVYAIKITVANTGDSYGYGLRIFNESGDIIEHEAIMDKFVALFPHKGRTDEDKCVYLLG